ncbi:zinc-dependent peptidase [Massilia norwichensis]|uniref:Zinc-dependent peptidase n=1 Tax=Massilia norwichensis TaxID=1442366 RepID=A0ABT2A8C5_9BURK|nr:M90 family metallopeptidase [Massilia norwichensis]MCS0590055.1 zinc-dependent peptidase [Massilia norwichensis]
MDTGATLVCTAIAAGLLLAWGLPRWRLRQALARPLSNTQLAIVERNVVQYRGMAVPLREQLQGLVKRFLHEKTFVGCAGLEVTEEMRVTIAAQACLLLLNRTTEVYPGLHAVLVYPGAFLVPRKQVDPGGVVTETRQDLLGESWGDGRVILSWDHVRRAGHDPEGAQNVVLHEFAHQLDSESGSTNGAPLLGSAERYRRWSETLARDFELLRRETYWGQRDVLDPYGASSPAEFFAVATESFFEQPHALAARHPELYAEFQCYFRVDPRDWFPLPQWQEPEPHGLVYGQWQ